MTLTGNDEASALTLPHATWATIRQLASTFSLTPSQVVERSVVAAQLTIDSFGCLPTAAERAQLSPATARQADATTALPAPGSEQQPSQPHSTPSTCPNEVEKFRQRRLRLQPQNNGKFKCDRCFRKRKRAEVKARNAALPEGVAKETVPPHSHKTCERLSAEDSFDGYACDTGMPEPDSTKLLPAGTVCQSADADEFQTAPTTRETAATPMSAPGGCDGNGPLPALWEEYLIKHQHVKRRSLTPAGNHSFFRGHADRAIKLHCRIKASQELPCCCTKYGAIAGRKGSARKHWDTCMHGWVLCYLRPSKNEVIPTPPEVTTGVWGLRLAQPNPEKL